MTVSSPILLANDDFRVSSPAQNTTIFGDDLAVKHAAQPGFPKQDIRNLLPLGQQQGIIDHRRMSPLTRVVQPQPIIGAQPFVLEVD